MYLLVYTYLAKKLNKKEITPFIEMMVAYVLLVADGVTTDTSFVRSIDSGGRNRCRHSKVELQVLQSCKFREYM